MQRILALHSTGIPTAGLRLVLTPNVHILNGVRTSIDADRVRFDCRFGSTLKVWGHPKHRGNEEEPTATCQRTTPPSTGHQRQKPRHLYCGWLWMVVMFGCVLGGKVHDYDLVDTWVFVGIRHTSTET
eukprot:GFYU01029053.1.p2 GENE.GFYU01029053.1~~GFYU01029053.1.p2  ORF type:complete len:128 (+),score=7.82 GFYU01029053.1:70-453(+)